MFLVGADEFAAFLEWKDPSACSSSHGSAWRRAPGSSASRLEAVLAELERPDRVSFFEIEPLPVSSSDIRARAAAGEPIDGLVPAAVAAEIGRLGALSRR